MSVAEQVEEKNDGEKDDTERKKDTDTSHLTGIVGITMEVKKGTVTGDTGTKESKGSKEGEEAGSEPAPNRRQ